MCIAIIARLHYLDQSYETFLFLQKCISSLSLITVSPIIDGCLPTLTSAAPTPEAVSQQQDILQRQREKQLREQMQPEQDVRLDGTDTGIEKMATQVGGANSDEASPCFPISEVELVGEEKRLNSGLRSTMPCAKHILFPASVCMRATLIKSCP